MTVELQPGFGLTERFEKLKFQENVSRSMSLEEGYEIQKVEPGDKQEIIELARRSFNVDEPLNHYLGVADHNGHEPDLEAYITASLDEGTSVKAVYEGRIVGFSVNGVLTKEKSEEECFRSKNERFQTILDFLSYNAKQCDIFKRYPNANKVMVVKILSVDDVMRGRGVAKKFMEKTRDISKEIGCDLMLVECTSRFSAAVCKRVGLTEIYSLNYSDYKINDKVVLQPAQPHTTFTVYVQEL